MPDNRNEEPSGEPEGSRDGEGHKPPPFVARQPFLPNDDSAAMTAIIAADRRRFSPAAFDSTNQVIGLSTRSMLSGAGTLTLDANVLPDWKAERAEMIGRLDAIESGFQKLRPFFEVVETAHTAQAPQIGHNNPPEPIDILPLNKADLEMCTAAVNLARAELNAEHPRSDVIRLCGLVLNQMAARVFQWIGARGEVFLDAFLKSAGTQAGKVVVTASSLAILMTGLHADLTDVVTKIRHPFELLHLPL